MYLVSKPDLFFVEQVVNSLDAHIHVLHLILLVENVLEIEVLDVQIFVNLLALSRLTQRCRRFAPADPDLAEDVTSLARGLAFGLEPVGRSGLLVLGVARGLRLLLVGGH